MAGEGSAFAPMRVPNFRWYFLSTLINTAGSTMAPVALAFAVLEVSDSPTALGAVLAANSIPLVLFMLFGGVIADRLPRVLIQRVGGLVLGITQGLAATLVITDTAELWMLIALEALNGVTLALVFPAFAAIMPQLVPRSMLQQANVLQSMSRGALRVVGPSVAGLLVVTVGPGWALAVDALTYLVSALLLLLVALPRPARVDADSASTFAELREGWSLFVGTTWLWVIVLAFSALNAIHAGALNTLGPVVAKDTIGEQGWGYVLSAESVGLLAMTAVMLRRRLERPLFFGMLGISTAGLPIILLGASPELLPLVALAFVAGAGIELFSLGWTLAMQENVEERMLSRAYSYDALGSWVAMPVGQLAYGPLALAFGSRDVLVASGVVYIAICLLTLLSGSVRKLQRAPADVAATAGG
jgi:MFS family permease